MRARGAGLGGRSGLGARAVRTSHDPLRYLAFQSHMRMPMVDGRDNVLLVRASFGEDLVCAFHLQATLPIK